MTEPIITVYLELPAAGSRPAVTVWRCTGAGLSGYGVSQEACRAAWQCQYDAEQARRRAAGLP
jgi:hypothetical protein